VLCREGKWYEVLHLCNVKIYLAKCFVTCHAKLIFVKHHEIGSCSDRVQGVLFVVAGVREMTNGLE